MRKQTMLRIFFAGEIIVFTGFYFYGSNGVFAVAELKKETAAIEQQIQITMQEIEQLQTTITAWQSDPFYKEKIARETLQMAHKDERIYTYTLP